MRLLQFEHFASLAEKKNLSETAADFGITKSALSHSIADLESELNVQLFNRSHKKMELTRAGETFLPYIERFHSYLDSAMSAAREHNDIETTSLSLALMIYLSKFPFLILSFKQQYPKMTLKITQQANDSEVQDILPKYDLTIFSSNTPRKQSNAALLFEEDICAAIAKDHPLAALSSISLLDCKDIPLFLSPKSKTTFSKILQNYFRDIGYAPPVHASLDDIHAIRALVSSKNGMALVPSKSWFNTADNNICLIPLNPPCKRYVYIGWHDEYFMSSASMRFKDFILSHADEIF